MFHYKIKTRLGKPILTCSLSYVILLSSSVWPTGLFPLLLFNGLRQAANEKQALSPDVMEAGLIPKTEIKNQPAEAFLSILVDPTTEKGEMTIGIQTKQDLRLR